MGEYAIMPGRKGPFPDDQGLDVACVDNWGAILVAEQGGKYMEWCRRGQVYAARSGAAAALPIFSTQTNGPALWNPSSSGNVVVPIKIHMTPVAVTSAVHTGFLLSYLSGCGDNYATGAPVITWTNIAPVSTQLGGGKVASTKFANGTVTYTVQPSVFADIGMIQNVDGTPATGGFSDITYEFDGSVMLAPGALMTFTALAATVNTFWVTILFAELPLVAGGLA